MEATRPRYVPIAHITNPTRRNLPVNLQETETKPAPEEETETKPAPEEEAEPTPALNVRKPAAETEEETPEPPKDESEETSDYKKQVTIPRTLTNPPPRPMTNPPTSHLVTMNTPARS